MFKNVSLDFRLDDELDVVYRKMFFMMQISGLRPLETIDDEVESPPIRPIESEITPVELKTKPGGFKPQIDDYAILEGTMEWDSVKDKFDFKKQNSNK